MNEEEGTFTRYLADPDDPESISNNTIRDICEDRAGRLWIATYGGLNRFHRAEERFTHYRYREGDPSSLPKDYVMCIRQTEPGSLWVGTWGGGGLARFNIAEERFRRYDLPDNRTYTLNVQDKEVIRIGSWGGGLMILEPESGEITRYQHEGKDRHSLSSDIVYSMYEDRSGILWIGTNGGGIDKLKEPQNEFVFHRGGEEDPGSLGDGEVNIVYIDSRGTLWAGTYNTGLNRYDEQEGRWIHYRADPEDPRSISDDIISCIYEDNKGRLWIGTNDGLNRYNRRRDDFTVYRKGESEDTLNDHIIYDVADGPEGDLWLGTYNSGVTRWDVEAGEMEHYSHSEDKEGSLSDNLVYELYVDSRNTLWVATNNGLNRWIPEEERFRSYYHDEEDPATLASDNVRSIYEARDGTLWLGTVSGGLNRFNREEGTFTHYMEREGLPSNTVYGILEDGRGRLWISTLDRLVVFDPQAETFQTVDEDNGVWAEEFSTGHFRSNEGTLYFGTAEGLYEIEPGELSRNSHVPPVHLTSFRVFDREKEFKTALTEVEKITLGHEENFFSVTFAALDFTQPEENRYAYKLEGFDQEWIRSGDRRYASYTNLPPGEYTLRVKGSNNDRVWNEQGTSVDIKVVPPPWRTLPAYLIYGAAAALLVYMFIRQFLLRQRRLYEQKTQELERQRLALLEKEVQERKRVEEQILAAKNEAEKANQAKNDFIANISHELRTPLNAILGYTQVLRNAGLRESQWESSDSQAAPQHELQAQEEQEQSPAGERLSSEQEQESLDSLERSGRQLLALINELLDLSAAEAGKLNIYYGPVNLRSLMQDIEAVYGAKARRKGLEFTAVVGQEVPEAVISDTMRMRQILFNLVGNAVKFTDGGFVQVMVKAAPVPGETAPDAPAAVSLLLEVKDSGIGISAEEQSRVFDPFTQQYGQSGDFGGTGLGLTITRRLVEALGGSIEVDSSPGEGSRFTVRLPRVEVSSAAGTDARGDEPGRAGEEEPRGGKEAPAAAGRQHRAGEGGTPGDKEAPAAAGRQHRAGTGEERPPEEVLADYGFTEQDFRPSGERAEEAREVVSGALYARWQEISAAFFIEEWREFARETEARGEDLGLGALNRYGRLLREALESFRLSRFRELAALYPLVAETVEKYCT
jgi:signal transduction histidine kinase/ligand-binding sensor domain-containing protein